MPHLQKIFLEKFVRLVPTALDAGSKHGTDRTCYSFTSPGGPSVQ